VRALARRSAGAVLTLGSLFLVGTTAGAADGPAASAGVRLEGERLSLRVDRLPLTQLVASLNRSGRVAVELHGDAAGIAVSDSFEDADVGHALRRLLSARSHVLIDRRTADATRVLEVILLPSRAAAGSEPMIESMPAAAAEQDRAVPPAPDAQETPLAEPPTEELVHEALTSATGTERAAAAEALAYRSPSGNATTEYAAQVLAQQLSDPDEQVRARALTTLKDTADEVPVNALAQLARDDASAERRIQALELLAERVEQEAGGPLRLALADPAPAVRERARELIEDWDLER
jgi:HEAT repeat protein